MPNAAIAENNFAMLGYKLEVSSDEAEKFGYTDSVSGVSALDVLVKAHELIYDKNFTAETKDDYLVVSEAVTICGEEDTIKLV